MFRNTPQPYLERRYPHPSGASRVRFVTTQPRFKSSCRCTPAQGIRRNENVECNLEDIRPSLRKCGPHARYVRGAVRFLVDRDAETRLATICRPSLCDFHPAGVACHNEHNRLRLHGGKKRQMRGQHVQIPKKGIIRARRTSVRTLPPMVSAMVRSTQRGDTTFTYQILSVRVRAARPSRIGDKFSQ